MTHLFYSLVQKQSQLVNNQSVVWFDFSKAKTHSVHKWI